MTINQPSLADLLDVMDAAATPDAMRTALAQHVWLTGGSWDKPVPGAAYAISCHGIHAMGATQAQAVEHWRITARTLTGGYAQPSHDPARARAQLAWAERMLAGADTCTDLTLSRACAVILALTADHTLRARADAIARQLQAEANERTAK